MNGRAQVGLVDYQEVRLGQEVTHIRRHSAQFVHAFIDLKLRVAQYAHPGIGDHGHDRVVTAAVDPVLAIAKEGEVVVGQPVEQGLGLGDVFLGQRRGGATVRPSTTSCTRLSIGRQSSTAARTSSSTRRMPASMLASAAWSACWSISMRIHDSDRTAWPWAPGSSKASNLPASSRRTRTIGWITRCTVRSWRWISALIESTRNGISSVDDVDDAVVADAAGGRIGLVARIAQAQLRFVGASCFGKVPEVLRQRPGGVATEPGQV